MLCFEASMGGLGYSTYTLVIEDTPVSPMSIGKVQGGNLQVETEYYLATFDPSQGGAITSLVDKKPGNRQLVAEGKLLNNLKGFFYEAGNFYQGADNEAKIAVVKDGDIFTQVQIENQISGINYLQWITFYKNNPRIDFSLRIDWDGQPGIGAFDHGENYKAEDRVKAFYNDKYKLHLEFHLNVPGDKLYKDAPFDVCESQLDHTLYTSWDSLKHNVILNWVDVTHPGEDFGIALFSDHTTSYLQTEDLALGLTVQYIGKALWGRNYIVHGPTTMEYALFPHEGDWERGYVQKANYEWNEPFIADFSNHPGSSPEKTILELNDPNFQVTSMIVQDESVIVRFYNSCSQSQRKNITWNCNILKIEQVDLQGNTMAEIPLTKDKSGQLVTELTLPQFGFQTLKLTGVTLGN